MNLFDLHCDTITELCRAGEDLVNRTFQLSIDRPDFDRYVQTFAIFVPDGYRGQAAVEYFERNLAYFYAQMERYASRIAPVHGGCELGRVLDGGRIAAVLSVEGGAVLAGDLRRIAWLKRQGVSLLTLTWNGVNELGSGQDENLPLTPFGRDAVEELERQSIVIDVSHLSDRGFDDLVRIARGPFVATHSNSRAGCDVPRNLTDDQFREIVRRGGLVGINFYPLFLRKTDPDGAGFRDILSHVEHFLALGGRDVLAIGSDFDGASMPREMNSVEKIANFYEFMLHSISDQGIVDQMFFENAHRFYRERITP